VIATIDVNPGPAAWTLEIAWVGGQRTRVEFLTSKGVHDIVEQAFRDRRTAAEIAQLLSERGAIQRSGPHIGQPYTATSVKLLIRKLGWERSFKRDAYIYLRARYLEGIPLRQIAKELNAQGVRHPLGEWTEHRVQRAIYRLRTHPVADVAQLPGIDRLADKVMALHDAGLFATEIAAKLRLEGALTMRRRPVTTDTVQQIVRRRRGLRSQDGGARKRRRAVRADGTRRATEATRETVVSPDAPMAQLLVGRPEARESTVLGAQDPIMRQ
jgi:hypothetical protein